MLRYFSRRSSIRVFNRAVSFCCTKNHAGAVFTAAPVAAVSCRCCETSASPPPSSAPPSSAEQEGEEVSQSVDDELVVAVSGGQNEHFMSVAAEDDDDDYSMDSHRQRQSSLGSGWLDDERDANMMHGDDLDDEGTGGDNSNKSLDEDDDGSKLDQEEVDLIVDQSGARSILLQELDETVNIPLTDRILHVGRELIASRSSSRATASAAATSRDSSLLHRNGFASATAHVTQSGDIRVHLPFLISDDMDLLPLCRAVARLHGAALRQDARTSPIKIQQTAMPKLHQLFKTHQQQQQADDEAAAALGMNNNNNDPGRQHHASSKHIILVSSADVVEDKIAVITVLAFDGDADIQPGQELCMTVVALRLFSATREKLVVPESS